eukprot:TRINITY_DN2426_c0_g1_i1.p1 TRINITY_DN2426_c0_g1~~TRINITY_DN2426_c0_g1_i1.p1  ORF type:complete len:794 (+),score=211.84 TRINITY_DN2426_c0_g1_i1:286-2382(+)
MADGDPFANLSSETTSSYVPSAAGKRQPQLKMADGDPFANFSSETAGSYVPSAAGRRQPQLKIAEGDPFADFFKETASSRPAAAVRAQVTESSSPPASTTETVTAAAATETAGGRRQAQLKMADDDPFANFFPETAGNSQPAEAKAEERSGDPAGSLPLAAASQVEEAAATAPVDEEVVDEVVEEVAELEQVGMTRGTEPSSSSLVMSSQAGEEAAADADADAAGQAGEEAAADADATGPGRSQPHEHAHGEHPNHEHDHDHHHLQHQGLAQDQAVEGATRIHNEPAAPGWSPTEHHVQEVVERGRSSPRSGSTDNLVHHEIGEETSAAQEQAIAPGWSPSIVLAQDQEKDAKAEGQPSKPASPHISQADQQMSEQIAKKSARTPRSAAALDGMETTLPLSMWYGKDDDQGSRGRATPRAAEEPENLDMKGFIAKLEHDLEMRKQAREAQQEKDRAREMQRAQEEKERAHAMEPATSSTRRRSSSAGPRPDRQRHRREGSSSLRQGNITERSTHPLPQPQRPLGVPPQGRPRMQSRMPAHLISWKPPNPEDMLTPKELGERAKQELTRRVQVALQNSQVTPVLGPESLQPELQSILAKESKKAAALGLKQEMLRVKTINDTIEKQAKLQEWYAQKEAAQEMELARQMEVREEQRRLVEAEERKRQRRQRELQRQLADWAVQKAAKEEGVQPSPRPIWV